MARRTSNLLDLTCDHLGTSYLGLDDVFRALADPTRRSLLDELFRDDGQTLTALEDRLPMSRFGVMKHLKVLEDAGLVVTNGAAAKSCTTERRADPAGPRPLGEQVRRAMGGGAQRPRKPGGEDHGEVFEIYIKTTPERLGRRSPTPSSERSTASGSDALTGRWDPATRPGYPVIARLRRDPRGRSAAAAGSDHARVVGRGGQPRAHRA